jgi:pilus assembly protein Flp/PilA
VGNIASDRRGASLVEYMMLVGLVALLAMGGFRFFGERVRARIEAQAKCIATFSCAEGEGSPGDDGSSGSGQGGPRSEPPIPTAAEVQAAIAAANASGDVDVLDSIDRFRQRLSPELQREYDALLQRLRDDERIRFVTVDGVTANPARDDLVLRGIAAAALGRPELLDDALQTAVDTRLDGAEAVEDGDGTFDVYVHPGPFDLAPYFGDERPGQAPGVATPTSDIVLDEEFLYYTIAQGEHLVIHEFSHILQRASDDGGISEGRDFPEDFDGDDEVEDALEEEGLPQLFMDVYGKVHEGREVFPSLQVLFETQPARLQAAAPEVYEELVDYHGFDPLTGRHAD